MRLVNLTPHPVNLPGLTVAPAGQVARCAETTEPRGSVEVDGHTVQTVAKRFGAVEGLPAPEAGVLFVVSALAAQAAWAAGRRDVVVPGEPTRDAEGRVTGAKALLVAP